MNAPACAMEDVGKDVCDDGGANEDPEGQDEEGDDVDGRDEAGRQQVGEERGVDGMTDLDPVVHSRHSFKLLKTLIQSRLTTLRVTGLI